MPTSVRGNSERGFTLVEVLVVLVIVAIAASMVSLSIGKGADPLREDARRLADAFTVAEGEARSDGRPIRWLPASGGWSFERRGAPPRRPPRMTRPCPRTSWNATRCCGRKPGERARCNGICRPNARCASIPNGWPTRSACNCARAIRA